MLGPTKAKRGTVPVFQWKHLSFADAADAADAVASMAGKEAAESEATTQHAKPS